MTSLRINYPGVWYIFVGPREERPCSPFVGPFRRWTTYSCIWDNSRVINEFNFEYA